MLDHTVPNYVFNGKSELYEVIRETRKYINDLELRVQSLELLLKDDSMANTSSNESMRVKVISKGKKK